MIIVRSNNLANSNDGRGLGLGSMNRAEFILALITAHILADMHPGCANRHIATTTTPLCSKRSTENAAHENAGAKFSKNLMTNLGKTFGKVRPMKNLG